MTDLAHTGLLAPRKAGVFCAFCGKPQHAAEMLVAGPAVHICDACIELSAAMLVKWRTENGKQREGGVDAAP